MTQKPLFALPIQQVAVCALPLIMTVGAYAQDVRDPGLASTLGTIFSPSPPKRNVFVADQGPGLDTGCTYNDDPKHPLIIKIPIDHYIDKVDANGFLIYPEYLIDKGILPATVNIIMPAYDVDIDASPPAEHDEVLFNGERLGLLTGENNR